MKKHIPNTVTLLASFLGALAIVFAFENKLEFACYCILLAGVCDFFDGFLARLLHAKSALGADLDSLSDVISFGVAPATIAFHLLLSLLPENLKILSYLAFLIVPFSALRLAIFNNSTEQTDSFLGLPVPSHAMLWVGLVFLKDFATNSFLHYYLFNPFVLLIFVVVFSLLLVSKLPLFSLKGNVVKNKLLWVFFMISVVLLFTFHLGGLFFIILIYILTGFFALLKKS